MKRNVLILLVAVAGMLAAGCTTPRYAGHRSSRHVVVVHDRHGPDRVIVKERPPRARREARSHRPSRRHVWVPGHWSWRSHRYVWARGYWTVPPRPHARWVAARWVRHGRHGWAFEAGYWR